MLIRLKDTEGFLKEVKVGYSWTVFFFGYFPMLFRKDWKWAFITFALGIICYFLTAGFAGYIPSIILSFIYNKIYIQDLLDKGYTPVGEHEKTVLQNKKFHLYE